MYEETFLTSLEENLKNISSFSKREGYLYTFKITTIIGDITLLLKVVFKKDGDMFLPTFFFKKENGSILRVFGHVYPDGEMCHNFSQEFMNIYDVNKIKEFASKYYVSLARYLKSLYWSETDNVLRSNIPENDLSQYERLQINNYFIIHPGIEAEDMEKFIKDKTHFYLFDFFSQGIDFRPTLHFNKELPGNPKYKAVYVPVSTKGDDTFEFKELNGENKIIGNLHSGKLSIALPPKRESACLLGLGSVGSFIFNSLLNDVEIGKIRCNDPDIYQPKNIYRSALPLEFINHDKIKAAAHLCAVKRAMKLKDVNNQIIDIDVFLERLVISQRLKNDNIISLKKLLKESNFIIDATGSDEVFRVCANMTDKQIFKIALYNSGKSAIFGWYNGSQDQTSDGYEKFISQWETMKNEKKLLSDSAYNSTDPANRHRTEMMASLFYAFVKRGLNNNSPMEVRFIDEDNIFG